MARSSWYLVAYDIADPGRLRRVHRYLKERGIWTQQSVFLFHGTRREHHDLLNGLAGIIHTREDDIRAYPVPHPGSLWFRGLTPQAGLPGVGEAEAGRGWLPRWLKRGGKQHG